MNELAQEMEDLISQGKIKESDLVCKKMVEAGMPEKEASMLWIIAYRKHRDAQTTDKAKAT